MKFKLFLITIFLSFGALVQAQLTITTNLREDGIFDEINMNWDITKTTEGLSVMNFNNELTAFRHITGNISSNYTIDDWTYNEEELLYEMLITSDKEFELSLIHI